MAEKLARSVASRECGKSDRVPIPFAPFTWIPGVIWFVLKMSFVVFMFAMVKAFVPRYRYDQLMRLGWKVFLPISLFMVVLVAGVLEATGWGVHH